ncbi:M48 family metalloprotease [Candidatus Nitrosacidococcus sp. I8]|uniref:beta-barrel assembly-enhancing protease n=1 Tax=Candidatus Nitrosacidococcus sp. I8 TaxID=2942908 RepID=UPI002226C266|nr:M48 family metalloprotease [Candidatus Nitrosacidococcus sp. I8]CAH9015296.1 Beta-barrel assembly-enhancing protease [Candidatus Nitrosacidococcus sp. I8]
MYLSLSIIIKQRKNLLTLIGSITFLIGLRVNADEIKLPEMGDHSAVTLSPEQERRIGQQFMQQLRGAVPIVDDPELTTYIQSLGYKLVAQSDNGGQNFTFFIIKNPTINAFAAPGGYIGIHSELILNTQTEGELAAVMAHEIAHITQHHLARSFEHSSRLSLPMTAAILAAIIAGAASGNPDAAMAGLIAAQAGSTQSQINTTRANEKEADRIGMQTLSKSGYDPFAMPSFFERLQQASRYYGLEPPEILSSHPVTRNRIADAVGRAEKLVTNNTRQLLVKNENDLKFYLMRARLQVLSSEDDSETVKYFNQSLKTGHYLNKEATQYGYALALDNAGNRNEAKRQILALLERDKDNLTYQLAFAEIEESIGQLKTAFDIYKKALDLYPSDYTIVINYTQALLRNNQPHIARDLLRAQMELGQKNGWTYLLLARAEENIGNQAESHRWMAEYYYDYGQIGMAISQLKLASKSIGNDFHEHSKIDARLRELEAEVKINKNSDL